MDKHVSDLDAERLFADASDPDPAQPLTRFTADVRAAYIAPAAEPTRAAHLQAMTETYAGLVATTPPVRANGRRRRRFLVRGTIAAAGLALVGGSAMAATGTLPDAAQDAVSSVARRIGVKLPRGHRAEIRILHPDVDRSDITIKVADKAPPKNSNDDDDDRDRVSGADEDRDSDPSVTDTSDRTPRRPRRDTSNGGSTVVDDGGAITPDDPSPDGGGSIDDRGDPSGGGGGDGGGGTEPDPGDGGTDPEPDPGDGDGGGGRGDPIDGSPPSGADEGSDEPASDPASGPR